MADVRKVNRTHGPRLEASTLTMDKQGSIVLVY